MKKRVFLILGILILFLVGCLAYVYFHDNLRFKLEYEVYNNIAFDNGKTISMDIPYDNKVRYVDEKSLKDILTTKTGVVYFGYPTCPWCRNIVPILTNVLTNSKIDTLYYVNVESVSTEGVKDILEEYLKEDAQGNKRLFVPDVYFIQDGKIQDHHRGTVSSYKNAFKGMNEEQKQELSEIYQEGIENILGDDRDDE